MHDCSSDTEHEFLKHRINSLALYYKSLYEFLLTLSGALVDVERCEVFPAAPSFRASRPAFDFAGNLSIYFFLQPFGSNKTETTRIFTKNVFGMEILLGPQLPKMNLLTIFIVKLHKYEFLKISYHFHIKRSFGWISTPWEQTTQQS